MSFDGARLWAVGVVSLLSLVYGRTAAAQECPYGYPVDCGTYCCESGAYCEGGGCYANQPDPGGGGSCPGGYPVDCGTYCCESGAFCQDGGCYANQPDPGGGDSCPAGYPVDCGTYCCESGAYCEDGGCYASSDPDPGEGSCPYGYPVDCSTYCCESGSYCQDGGCYASSDPGPGEGLCPAGYPVDCGTFCCGSGASCGANETCLAGSYIDQYVDAACPDGYPVDCGNDYCCPSGSSCTVDGCLGVGGSPIDGSQLICASQIVDTDNGSCNLDFCISNSNGSCESYYVVNGDHIYCSGCAADATCVLAAGQACAGRGVSTDPSAPTPSAPTSPGSGECCGSDDACDWANDGACDCSGMFADSWDAADCKDDSDVEPEICTVRRIGASDGTAGGMLAFAALGIALFARRRTHR
jgi:hypothetical protein